MRDELYVRGQGGEGWILVGRVQDKKLSKWRCNVRQARRVKKENQLGDRTPRGGVVGGVIVREQLHKNKEVER